MKFLFETEMITLLIVSTVTGYGGAALIQLHLIKLQKKMIDNDYILGN